MPFQKFHLWSGSGYLWTWWKVEDGGDRCVTVWVKECSVISLLVHLHNQPFKKILSTKTTFTITILETLNVHMQAASQASISGGQRGQGDDFNHQINRGSINYQKILCFCIFYWTGGGERDCWAGWPAAGWGDDLSPGCRPLRHGQKPARSGQTAAQCVSQSCR